MNTAFDQAHPTAASLIANQHSRAASLFNRVADGARLSMPWSLPELVIDVPWLFDLYSPLDLAHNPSAIVDSSWQDRGVAQSGAQFRLRLRDVHSGLGRSYWRIGFRHEPEHSLARLTELFRLQYRRTVVPPGPQLERRIPGFSWPHVAEPLRDRDLRFQMLDQTDSFSRSFRAGSLAGPQQNRPAV